MKWNGSWLMLLCVAGMGALFILPLLGISLGSLFTFLLILLCPLSHLLMMRMGRSGGGGCHGNPQDGREETVHASREISRPNPADREALVGVRDLEPTSRRDGMER